MMFTHKTMKQYRETAGIAALAIGLSACAGTPALSAPDTGPTANLVEAVTYEYPFRDPSLSPEARAADLVSRLTLEEKAAQMYDKAAPVERSPARRCPRRRSDRLPASHRPRRDMGRGPDAGSGHGHFRRGPRQA